MKYALVYADWDVLRKLPGSARDTLDDAEDARRELAAVQAVVLFFWCNCGQDWIYVCRECYEVLRRGPRLANFECPICEKEVEGLDALNRKVRKL